MEDKLRRNYYLGLIQYYKINEGAVAQSII